MGIISPVLLGVCRYMDRIVQRIRVVASDREGYALVVQTIDVIGKEYKYEVKTEDVEVFIDELDKQFKQMMKELLKGFE